MPNQELSDLVENISRASNDAEQTEARMIRFILREVSPEVSPSALRVLLFIFDRTYTYGKVAEHIPYRHFLEGVTWNDKLLHPPVDQSLATLKRSIKELCDNVIIIVSSDRKHHRTTYMINPLWVKHGKNVSRNVTQQKNKSRSMAHVRAEHGSPVSRPWLTRDLAIEQEDSNMGNITGAALPHSLTDLVSNTSAKTAAARQKRKEKGNATAFAKMWEDSFRVAYPEEQYFAWRVSELAAFKRALQRGKLPAPVIPGFIDFVVTEFPSVVSERFGWMRTPPTVPVVAFVTKHVEVFYRAYLDKDDPNRKVRGRVARAEKPEPVPAAGHDEVKKLQQKLDAERARRERAEREANALKDQKAQARRASAKKLVLKRPSRSAEFGDWDDEG